MALDQDVKVVCEALDALADAVYEGKKDDQVLNARGWNHPALTRHELSAVASNLSVRIAEACDGQTLEQEFLDSLAGVDDQLKSLQAKTVPQLYATNGNELQAYPAYFGTLFAVEQLFSPVLKPRWEALEDPNLMPKNLATRVRSIRSLLDGMDGEVPELQAKLRLIVDAHSAAESLPADTALLQEARAKISKLGAQSETDAALIAGHKSQADTDRGHVADRLNEAEGLIAQLRELHRVGTSTTLAGAFQKRADSLSRSVWAWLAILVVALIAGVCIGLGRIETVTAAMNEVTVQWSAVWVNVILTMLSVSAPVWLGWVATKQIAQRFRLAEDYAYKASISNAYEGYRREAVNLDASFQTRLFDSALTRLDETPGRLVDAGTHGSPLHELFQSDVVLQAVKLVPSFAQNVKELAFNALQGLPGVSGTSTRSKSQTPIAENPEKSSGV